MSETLYPRRDRYAAIDVHSKPKTSTWPATIPAMTEADAMNATRRLYRWATRKTFTGVVKITSGNRRAMRLDWTRSPKNPAVSVRCFHVNPSQGWREFAHEASHWFDYIVNGVSKHGKHHARFEAKLIAQIVDRGWLEAAPVEVEAKVIPLEAPGAKQRAKLVRLDEREKRWTSKAKRAATALAKISKERRAVERAIAKIEAAGPVAPAPRKLRAKVESVTSKADRLGIEVERITGGHNVYPPESIEDERDPYDGDHFASDWSEVRVRVNAYAAMIESAKVATC